MHLDGAIYKDVHQRDEFIGLLPFACYCTHSEVPSRIYPNSQTPFQLGHPCKWPLQACSRTAVPKLFKIVYVVVPYYILFLPAILFCRGGFKVILDSRKFLCDIPTFLRHSEKYVHLSHNYHSHVIEA